MSRVVLAVSARHDERMDWMCEFVAENASAVAQFNRMGFCVMLNNGDTVYWRLLDESLFGMQCDQVWLGESVRRGLLDDRQREMLTVVRSRVRPRDAAIKNPPADR